MRKSYRSVFSRKDIEDVISGVAEGSSLREQLRLKGIHAEDFGNYIFEDAPLWEQYARARKIRTELIIDEMVSIADEECDPNRARVRIDTRKWIASKLNPSLYGDRLDINVTQTVDIGSALKDARSRALPQNTQVLEIVSHQVNGDTGLEPVEAGDASKNSSDDIFD